MCTLKNVWIEYLGFLYLLLRKCNFSFFFIKWIRYNEGKNILKMNLPPKFKVFGENVDKKEKINILPT